VKNLHLTVSTSSKQALATEWLPSILLGNNFWIMDYAYDVLSLCRTLDPAMGESKKREAAKEANNRTTR